MPLLVESGGSPVRVTEEAVFASPRTVRAQPTALQLSAHAITIIYSGLVGNGMWDASFARGPTKAHGQRGLASYHLSAPGTDGWNVVAGALELARIWALRATTTSIGLNSATGDAVLDRSTRTRLAVCLAVSWKFQRCLMSTFAKRFQDVGEFHGWPADHEGHTRELAHIGFGFLFKNEQRAFGGWKDDNLPRIRELYSTMLRLEVDLLKNVPVFTLLTENAQVEAEARLGLVFDAGQLSAERCMAVRSIVPFFLRAAAADAALYGELMGACDVGTSAGALVCAGCYCLASAFGMSGMPEFAPAEHALARRLLDAALSGVDEPFLRQGCYGNPAWEAQCCVSDRALRLARRALDACAARESVSC